MVGITQVALAGLSYLHGAAAIWLANTTGIPPSLRESVSKFRYLLRGLGIPGFTVPGLKACMDRSDRLDRHGGASFGAAS